MILITIYDILISQKYFIPFTPKLTLFDSLGKVESSDDSSNDSDTADTAESNKDHTWSLFVVILICI